MDDGETLDPRWLHAFISIEHWHFHARLYQHYKIVLAPGEFSALRRALKEGRLQLIERRGENAIFIA